MNSTSKIYVAGHSGLVGRYLTNELIAQGYKNILTRSSKHLDLTNLQMVESFFEGNEPEYVFLVAAKKAGVGEYFKTPVEFFNTNMIIEMNILQCAQKYKVKKLVFVGASCVYPESEGKTIYESDFETGWVQKATEPYALAKAAGTKLCQYYNKEYGTNFVTAFLVNIYGLTDNEHLDTTSVLPALVTRFKNAVDNKFNQVEIWGNGETKREFLHGRDCADALIKIMEKCEGVDVINVGSGSQVTINELAAMVAKATGFEGEIVHDLTKPNGSNRSVLDISRLKLLEWRQKTSLEDGIKELVERM